MGINYEQTVLSHYQAFWDQGVPVDVIDMTGDFSKYKLVVAPMLYMVRPGVGERIEQFVAGGGTFVATYWSGIVDENDLVFLGGFPGPLRQTLGIWSEEIDGLYDHDENQIIYTEGNSLELTGAYKVRELCELIHLEGAQALAVYGDDFYAGRPALTVNQFGQGKAYYIAARAEQAFQRSFYKQIIKEAKIEPALRTELPHQVTAQIRTDGVSEFIFLMNFSDQDQAIMLDEHTYSDMLASNDTAGSGTVSSSLVLQPYGVRVLKRSKS